MITFRLETITPELAEAYLRLNDPKNRNMRSAALKDYCAAMKDGSWQVTHQAIAFDASGMLIDGQHRLKAVIMSGAQQQMYVARYDSEQSAMNLSIDRNARRSFTDILKGDREIVELASFMYSVVIYGATPTIKQVEYAVDAIQDQARKLIGTCSTKVRTRGSVCVRGAVLTQMMLNPHQSDAIANNYRAFVLLDFDNCCASAKAFLKTLDNLSVKHGSDRMQVLCRALKAFDPTKFDMKVNRYGDAHDENKDARQLVQQALNL
jgi:hypothetical protein